MAWCFHACGGNAGRHQFCLLDCAGKVDSMITSHKLYPALPIHEQVRKPFEWPKRYDIGKDDVKEFSKEMKKIGGRPKKGVTPIHISVLSALEQTKWASCMDLSIEIGKRRRAIQGVVRVLYANGTLHRRRRSPREYEYALAELPNQPR